MNKIHHEEALKTLKTAKGQIESTIKMIEENRYCIDISKQVLAVTALLKKANIQILKKHLESCVLDAALSKDSAEISIKIKELEDTLEYINRV
ncbi:MAG TPA: metal-sensing transcriptional repressor [Petrotogaceae bacterium]|jgi:DNA-binding FrmR family transcriptional regulator|nr:metal-sensing transcriptional repressor [Petrotogaceae bacterium]HPO26742.1 metal-sensing transcriptional repressor [Petrotogaceae bacterium]HPO26751.1 metal-sensing transcriptional repressor [Petrotogaceae bacterium]HQC41419.1 metal-sensing transcriptional repressor [Petrotogaceae bacterium]